MRRASRFGVLGVVGVAIVAGLGVPIFRDYRSTIASLERLEGDLHRYRAIAADHTMLAARAAEVNRQRARNTATAGGSDGAMVAALQGRVQSIVGGAGGRVSRVEVLAVDAGSKDRKLGARVSFSTSIEGLRSSLHALEFGQPRLLLDRLSIRARDVRAFGAGNPLDVQVDAYILSGG